MFEGTVGRVGRGEAILTDPTGQAPALVGLLDDIAGYALGAQAEGYGRGQRDRAEDDQERRGGQLPMPSSVMAANAAYTMMA